MDVTRETGVAFAISNKFASKLTSLPTGLSERIILLRAPTGNDCYLSVINVYAPTMMYPDEEKEAFYEKLAEVVDRVPREEKLLILGDFNARVCNDHTTYDGTLGKFGKGKKNSNGELIFFFIFYFILFFYFFFYYYYFHNYIVTILFSTIKLQINK